MRANPDDCPRASHFRQSRHGGHLISVAIAVTMSMMALSIGLKLGNLSPLAGVAGLNDRAPRLEEMLQSSPQTLATEAGACNCGQLHDGPNVRVSVSQELVNRLLSQPRIDAGPWRQETNMSSIVGERTTNTQLSVRLFPDDDTWRLELLADGTITADATVHAGAATFFVDGSGSFHSSKLMAFDGDQIHLARAEATGDFDFELNGLQTRMDAVPLFGRIARDSARSKLRHRQAAVRQKLQAEVENHARDTLDRDTTAFVNDAKAQIEIQALSRLRNLELPLSPVRLQTTQERLIGDYYLAGIDQAGADEPPPTAPDGGLASVQLHQSAINNVLDRLQLNAQELDLRDLCRQVSKVIGQPDALSLHRVPEGIAFRFAVQQPLHVELRDGRAHLVARLATFRMNKRRWQDLTVSCAYRLDERSQRPVLQRVGDVEVACPQARITDRMVLTRVFARMFACLDSIQFMPEKLVPDELVSYPGLTNVAVMHCRLDDGWLALALGSQPSINAGIAEAATLSQH